MSLGLPVYWLLSRPPQTECLAWSKPDVTVIAGKHTSCVLGHPAWCRSSRRGPERRPSRRLRPVSGRRGGFYTYQADPGLVRLGYQPAIKRTVGEGAKGGAISGAIFGPVTAGLGALAGAIDTSINRHATGDFVPSRCEGRPDLLHGDDLRAGVCALETADARGGGASHRGMPLAESFAVMMPGIAHRSE